MQNTIGNKAGSRKMMMMLLLLSLGKVPELFVSRMLKQWPRGVLTWRAVLCTLQSSWSCIQCEHLW